MAKATQDDVQYDVRIRPHQIRSGALSPADVDAYLASLPDEAEEGVESSVRFHTPYADRVRQERGGKT